MPKKIGTPCPKCGTPWFTSKEHYCPGCGQSAYVLSEALQQKNYAATKALQLLLRRHAWEFQHYRKMGKKQGKDSSLSQSYSISNLRRKYPDELREIYGRFRENPSLIGQELPEHPARPCETCGTPWPRSRMTNCPGCGLSRFRSSPKAQLMARIRLEARKTMIANHHEEFAALYNEFSQRMPKSTARSHAKTKIIQRYRDEYHEEVRRLTEVSMSL